MTATPGIAGRCETCRWWRVVWADTPQKADDDPRIGVCLLTRTVADRWGTDDAPEYPADYPDSYAVASREYPACACGVTVEQAGYAHTEENRHDDGAILETHAGFGCVQWEARA